jgi:hypothetical protein
MLNILITLGILLVIQIYLVLYASDKIKISEANENYYNLNLLKKFVEIIVIIIVILYTCYFYLRNKMDYKYLMQITVFIEIFIVLFWLYLNLVESKIIDYGPDSNPFQKTESISDPTEIHNINNFIKNEEDNKKVFSKYIDKRENDFRFEDLYPNYNKSNLPSTKKNNKIKDYSAYNGVSPSDICYNCGCMKKLDGSEFCGKDIGGAIFGCSENWKCHNCKKCQTWDNKNNKNNNKKKSSNNTSNTQYECSKCQCYDSKQGVICGKKTKLTGDIIRCNNMCERCSICKTDNSNSDSNSDVGFKTVKPETNINNIIINNLTMDQLDNLL